MRREKKRKKGEVDVKCIEMGTGNGEGRRGKTRYPFITVKDIHTL